MNPITREDAFIGYQFSLLIKEVQELKQIIKDLNKTESEPEPQIEVEVEVESEVAPVIKRRKKHERI